jgi:hypothetical protein
MPIEIYPPVLCTLGTNWMGMQTVEKLSGEPDRDPQPTQNILRRVLASE